jgi:hypothetical protein
MTHLPEEKALRNMSAFDVQHIKFVTHNLINTSVMHFCTWKYNNLFHTSVSYMKFTGTVMCIIMTITGELAKFGQNW